ncbi:MAG TPA: methyltransferase domain-containing protein [Candidatus Paceibacterota bacterium]
MDTIKKKWHAFVERGAIADSSLWLAERITKEVPFHPGAVVIELGAGKGIFTGFILKKMHPSGRLLVIESNKKLAQKLTERFHDARVHVISGDAMLLSKHLEGVGLAQVDHVISGLPIGNFSSPKVEKILREIEACLKPAGRYAQFQYFLASYPRIKKVFQEISIQFEPRNIPPAFVITSRKASQRL